MTTGVAQTTAQTETVAKTLGGEILQTIQENSLPIIAALAVLIILFAALTFRGRRSKNSNR
jgi:ABC-type spermidine/putrescine transport system permease subunit II